MVAFLKRNFIFLSTSRVVKCLDVAHSGLFITCVYSFLIFCMRQTLVKIVISICVFEQFKMKFLCDFQDHNTWEEEQVVSPNSSDKIAAFYLRKVRVCVNNLYSQLYKHNFILTDVEILVVSNLGQLNGSFSNQWKLMCLYMQTSIFYHCKFMEH